MPGFGFSGPTRQRGWNRYRVARAWAELMRRLAYDRYGAVGNDGGSLISPEVGRVDPEHVCGVHVTQVFSFPSGDPAELAALSEEERGKLAFAERDHKDILSWNVYDRGSHFAAHDAPDLLVHGIRQFFRQLR